MIHAAGVRFGDVIRPPRLLTHHATDYYKWGCNWRSMIAMVVGVGPNIPVDTIPEPGRSCS